MINASQFPGAHASILNQAKRRKVQAGRAVEDAEEAPHSGKTGELMQSFFNALQDDDEHEQRHAFGKVVEAWRADNAAGGLAVYAHMPLPGIFASATDAALRRRHHGSASGQLGQRSFADARLALDAGGLFVRLRFDHGSVRSDLD